MPPPWLPRLTGIFTLNVLLFSAGGAWAASWLFTTNDTYGQAGKKLTLGTRSVTFADGATVTTVPCQSAEASLSWATSTGQSNGMGVDPNTSVAYIWAGITGASTDSGCAASTGNNCIGAARYDLSSSSMSRDYAPIYDHAGAKPVDIVGLTGNTTRMAVAEKQQEEVRSWAWNNTLSVGSAAPEVSQLEWLDSGTGYYVASTPNNHLTPAQCDSASPAVEGSIQLRKLGTSTVYDTNAVSRASSGETTKPEGMTVVAIDPSHSATCRSDADYVVYVADYCQSRIHVFTFDESDEELNIELTGNYAVDLDEDADGHASDFGPGCHPSGVHYHSGTGKLYAVCQERETVIPLVIGNDQCAPAWAHGNERELGYLTTGTPTCSSGPTSTTTCAGGCGPHGFAYDTSIASDWAFVNLTPLGQVVAVQLSNLSHQYVMFRDTSSFRAYELELGAYP